MPQVCGSSFNREYLLSSWASKCMRVSLSPYHNCIDQARRSIYMDVVKMWVLLIKCPYVIIVIYIWGLCVSYRECFEIQCLQNGPSFPVSIPSHHALSCFVTPSDSMIRTCSRYQWVLVGYSLKMYTSALAWKLWIEKCLIDRAAAILIPMPGLWPSCPQMLAQSVSLITSTFKLSPSTR